MEYTISCNQKVKLFFKKTTTNDERKKIFNEIFDEDCLFKIVRKMGISNEIYRLGDIMYKLSLLNDFEKYKFLRRYVGFKKFDINEDDFILLRSIITSIKSTHIYSKIIVFLYYFNYSFPEEMVVFFILNRKVKEVLRLLEKLAIIPTIAMLTNSTKIKDELYQLFHTTKETFTISGDILIVFPELNECLTINQKSDIIL